MQNSKKQLGFTIVELLIVIVVIGILAAITIVAYNSVQDRANDTVVQADLRQMASQIAIFYAEEGHYPSRDDLDALDFKVSKSSYNTANNAMLYCTPINTSDYGLVAESTGGTVYYVSNETGSIREYDELTFPQGYANICPTVSSAGTGDFMGDWIHSGTGWKYGV